MSTKGRKSTKPNKTHDRLGMLGITFTVLVMLGIMMGKSRALSEVLASYDAREEMLLERLEQEQDRTEQIEQLRDYMQTDEYAEQVARERLGLVKDNEIVFEEIQ